MDNSKWVKVSGDKYELHKLSFSILGELVSEGELEAVEEIYRLPPCDAWLTRILIWSLSDKSPYVLAGDIESVSKMIDMLLGFNERCAGIVGEINSGLILIDYLVKYSKQDRWMIDATKGLRPVTKQELDEAVMIPKGKNEDGSMQYIAIENQPSVALSEKENRFISAVIWLMYGRWSYAEKAEVKVEYNKDGLVGTEIGYVLKNSNIVFRVIELLEDFELEKVYEKVKKIKNKGKFKYPEYASDEVEMDSNYRMLTVLNQIDKVMPSWRNALQFRVVKIMSSKPPKKKYNPGAYTTEEKLLIRQCYYEIKLGYEEERAKRESLDTDQMKADCIRLVNAARSHKISNGSFALRIAKELLQRYERSQFRMSAKQYSYVKAELDKLDERENNRKNVEKAMESGAMAADISSDDSGINLVDMMNNLGNGMFSSN